ncbi:unnamed protein product [Orchesella dallaii]|uniref:Uncharacterized protein n=1 Tax=Orchesella dallaii TaxID=48710 RepID=A0ABP1Q8Z8_9HEXA
MQGMHWFPFTYYSLAGLAVVLVTSSKIPQVLSDDTCNEKIQCKEGQLVLPAHMLKIRNNCTTELDLTAENQTCSIHCMFDQMKLLDDSGKPSLTAYQAFANLEICASLSENARNCDCFRFGM